ncbi:MAG: NAD-dependent epimerase/dehydratase family protein [Candidatus Levyibacteriota bacterium]
MQIAITGDSGFLGTELKRELRKSDISFSVFEREKYNLFKPETLKDFVKSKNVIIHLAGANKDKSLEEIIKVNVLGTKGLLDAINMYSPFTKLVFASSFMVYLQNDFFGVSKKVAEDLIIEYARERSIKSIILRFSNIYGEAVKPFCNSVISTFAYKIKRDEQVIINGDGTQRRDYICVKDAVSAFMKAIMYKPKKIECFDICSGKLTSLNEILDLMEKVSHKEINLCYNKNLKLDDLNIKKDYTRAKEILNWEPTVLLKDGLKTFFNSLHED